MAKLWRRPKPDLELDLRIVVDGTVVIGPVQAAVLARIRDCGSNSGAQRQLGATYVHVWKQVAAMSERFVPPVVAVARGGTQSSGARLTPHRRDVLGTFRRLEKLQATHGQPELGVTRRATASAVARTKAARTPN